MHSFEEVRNWIIASGHGSTQNRRAIRIVSGLPRSFVWIGDEGMLIKRFLLRDPYTHVTLWRVISQQFWLIVAFYVFGISLLWVLVHSASGQRVLEILAAAVYYVLVFALLTLDPSSAERYLPAYPIPLCRRRIFASRDGSRIVFAVSCCVAFMSIAIMVRT